MCIRSVYPFLNKRVIRRNADDSQPGGRCHRIVNPIQGQLLLSVMGLDINLLAIDYPKVSTDKGRFTDGISAILAKALSCAKIYCDSDHTVKYNVEKAMRAGSGFSRLHRPYNKLQGLNIYYSYPVLISTEACFLLCLKITLQMYKEYFRLQILI